MNTRGIKAVTKDKGANHLGNPVENIVQGTGTNVELGQVDGIELVSSKPVAGKEHGEEGNNVPVRLENGGKTDEFRFPGWVLHEDDTGAV